jgi:hypothetical protein
MWLKALSRMPTGRPSCREGIVAVWTLRAIAVLLSFISAFGFLNALYLKIHGPGWDLGVGAGVLALLAWVGARWKRRNSS